MMLQGLLSRKKHPAKILVLMYHRICRPGFDPWELMVSPEHFEQQLMVLSKQYTVLPVSSINALVQEGQIPERAICLSFDDGYADNARVAAPLLQQYGLPACFFISDYFLEAGQPFWWDELVALYFPVTAAGSIAADWYRWTWPNPAPDARTRAFLDDWMRLKAMPYAGIRKALEVLKEQRSNDSEYLQSTALMTREELVAIGKQDLFELGVHTHTHPALSAHSAEVQQAEIAANQQWLRQIPGAVPEVMAFPYGDFNATTLAILPQLGINTAFTTQGISVQEGCATLQLGRFQVKDWDGLAFADYLEEWFRKF